MLLEELVLPLRTDHSAFKAGIAFAAASVAALVAGMGLAIKATFKWADELDKITDVMGVSNKTAAALNFTLRKSGVATETLTRGMVILSKGLIKADGSLDTTGKSLKAWGINVLDANGMLKDQTTLIGDISEKYASFSTQQEKVNFLTETFGRSGAELIDFFDTLANDGGIDSVAAKIERLGLAIDPNRYEQFNRNLEELKLVGLAMAVGFTEKVMPVIEGFLKLISDPKLTLSGFAKKADKFIGGLIDGIANSIDNWVSGGGPEELSEKIISWVENLGEGGESKSKILAGAQKLVTAIGDAIKEIDWAGIATAIDEKTAETIGNHDWQAAGDSFGDKVEELFRNALEGENKPNLGETWGLEMLSPGIHAIVTFFQSDTGGALATAVKDWLKGAFGEENLAVLKNWSFDADAVVGKWARGVSAKFSAWAADVIATNKTWSADVNNTMNTALSDLALRIDSKLRDIAKAFFNRATAWGQQMLQGFAGSQGALFSAISGMVAEINGLLRKIITSFHLTITFSEPTLGGASGTSNLGGNSGPGTGGGGGGGGGGDRRASGGPVIAGSPYSVAEFFRPERFTPNVSGRIDPMQSQAVVATIDEGRLARVIVQALMQSGFSG